MAKEIPITRGSVVIVDDEDYDFLSSIPWYDNGKRYAVNKSRFFDDDGNRKQVLMHRLIIDVPEGFEVDHINNNPLDNRKCNLRVASRNDNVRNTRKPITNTSGFKGVSKTYNKNKWCARISCEDKNIYIGTYENKEDAAKAYNIKAIELFGEFAHLNDVDHTGFILQHKRKNSSKYRGVSRKKNRWNVGIYVNGKRVDLGSYKDEYDAARMYSFWANDIYGEFAKLNVINEEESA